MQLRITNVLSETQSGSPTRDMSFPELMKWHLDRGTRPPGELQKKWHVDELGRAVGVAEGTIRNWRDGKNLPPSAEILACTFFGKDELKDDPQYNIWRAEMRGAYEKATRRGPNRVESIKEKLQELLTSVHEKRSAQMRENKVTAIHNFGRVWGILLNQMFAAGETLSDFTVSSDALHRFEEYEFGHYYNRIMKDKERESPGGHGDIRILMRCDEVAVRRDHIACGELSIATWKVFEQAVMTVLKNAPHSTFEEVPPDQLYLDLSAGKYSFTGGGRYEFRLVSERYLRKGPTHIWNNPFNVYGKLIASRSIVPSFGVAPVPHIEVIFDSDEVQKHQDAFDLAWKAAEESIERIAATMVSWELFGSGRLMKQWVVS